MDRLIKLISTFFYLGEVPFAPGTVGSLAGVLLFLAAADHMWVYAALFTLIACAGFLVAGRAEKIFGKKDPHEIVIDEVAGVAIVFFMIPPHWVNIIIGFILYRALDIFKPFPIRRLEGLKGGFGIMADDLACGIYANLILQGFLKFGILW